jgi:hypothetical protein
VLATAWKPESIERRFHIGQGNDTANPLLEKREDIPGVPAGATTPMSSSILVRHSGSARKVGISGKASERV